MNHEGLIVFFFLHPLFIFSNLAKRKSDYSVSTIITYLKAQWLYSSNTFFMSHLFGHCTLSYNCTQSLAAKRGVKAVRLAATSLYLFLRQEYTEIAHMC